MRAYRKVLTNLAMQLAPHMVDAQRREDPLFPNHLSAQDWQNLFDRIEHAPLGPCPGNGWYEQSQQDVAQMERRLHQIEDENRQLRRQVADLTAAAEKLVGQLQAAKNQAPVQPAGDGVPHDDQGASAVCYLGSPLDAADLSIPPVPPTRFQVLFQDWAREGLVLALLAGTGWNLRHAIDEALAQRVGIGTGAGSTKRLFYRLEKQGLVQNQVYDLGSLRAAILVLTPKGENVVRAAGMEVVPSQWSILMHEHGGAHQAKHAALCCTFAYQARKRGWVVSLCPPVEGPAQPDVGIVQGNLSIYVEVEAESGEPERRMRKWRNQAELQGFVALCANSDSVRARLVSEAKAAAPHGVATDVSSLVRMARQEEEGIWVETWGKGTAAVGG